MITAVLIDDEEKTHKIVSQLIEAHFPNIQIVANAKNVAEGIDIIHSHFPDIVFLDVNMPDGTGFDLLKKLKFNKFKLIFITAHQENALQAIKFSAIDFILKPIDILDFISALNRTTEALEKEYEQIKIKAFLSNFENITNQAQKLILKTTENIYVVNIQNIIRCKSENNYTTFFLNDGKKILISKTLKEYEELLQAYDFIRIHRSHLINLNYIERFEKRDSGFVYMKDNSKIPVSHRKREILLRNFGKLLNP